MEYPRKSSDTMDACTSCHWNNTKTDLTRNCNKHKDKIISKQPSNDCKRHGQSYRNFITAQNLKRNNIADSANK